MENKTNQPALCANCQQELPAADVIFCPRCGQKNSSAKVSMREFMDRFFHHVTHLDNKFLRSVRDLFVPGKITDIYFRGRRKHYPHPVQLFFIVMFFFLIAANHYSNRAIRINTSDTPLEDNSADEFFQMVKRHSESLQLRRLADSLPPAYRDVHTLQAIDSLLLLSHDPVLRRYQHNMLESFNRPDSLFFNSRRGEDLWQYWPMLDSVSLKFVTHTYRMDISDVALLSEEALVEKYQVDGFFNRLFLKQGIKIIHDPTGLTKAYFGSFSWTILVLVGLMAAFMRLLYRKQRRYYIEHFVFLLHWHSGILLLLAVILLIGWKLDVTPVVRFALGWAALSLFWAMYRYYQLSWVGAAWRGVLFSFVYILAFGVVFVGALLAVLLLF